MTANLVYQTISRVGRASFLLLVFALATAVPPSFAGPTIPNPSFEANAIFEGSRGYVSENTAIIGWKAIPADRVGLNRTTTDSFFANNGALPTGPKVALLQ